jgi:hypothetical protein
MKKIITSMIVLSALFIMSCKKTADPTPDTTAQTTSNYDLSNNIFRVIVSSTNVAYTVTVTTTNTNNPNSNASQQGTQSAGTTFEYPFTPTVGDSINITAQSAQGVVNMYVYYKGTQLGPVSSTTNSTGGTTVTYAYVVK